MHHVATPYIICYNVSTDNGEAGQGMPAKLNKESWRRKGMDAYRAPSERSARERSARAMVKAMKVLGRRQAKPSEYVLDGGKDAAEQWLLEMGIGFHTLPYVRLGWHVALHRQDGAPARGARVPT